MRQRELEMRLEAVPPHPRPSPNLEQYRTPPVIAADLLYRALAAGDIADRDVVDLGCGTGMFTIGALLLGAAKATGVDLDGPSLDVARRTADAFGVEAVWVQADATTYQARHDTVVMNPPFGAQFAARNLDSRFVEAALGCAHVVYSLHAAETSTFVERHAVQLGAHVRLVRRYEFPLPAQFRFHQKERLLIPVLLYRFDRGPA